jgi:hypothetical protein
MVLIFALLRGVIFYLSLLATGFSLGWLILTWRAGISVNSPQMMMAMAGGGAILFLSVVVLLSVMTIKYS